MFIFQNQCILGTLSSNVVNALQIIFLLRTVTTKRLFIAFDSYYVEPVLRVGDR